VTRFLYLHGFASGPDSSKGLAFEKRLAGRSVPLQRLNLRLPSLQHLLFSEMAAAVRKSLGGPDDRGVVIGSSLGGLLAAHAAARDPRVQAAVLLAPAVRLAGLFRKRLGPATTLGWEQSGWLEIDDYVSKTKTRLHWLFMQELEDLEARGELWPAVKVPALVVLGKADDTVPAELVRAWVREQPNARLIEVEDGHDLKPSLSLILDETERFLAPWL
jgi:uncharacterized protein